MCNFMAGILGSSLAPGHHALFPTISLKSSSIPKSITLNDNLTILIPSKVFAGLSYFPTLKNTPRGSSVSQSVSGSGIQNGAEEGRALWWRRRKQFQPEIWCVFITLHHFLFYPKLFVHHASQETYNTLWKWSVVWVILSLLNLWLSLGRHCDKRTFVHQRKASPCLTPNTNNIEVFCEKPMILGIFFLLSLWYK